MNTNNSSPSNRLILVVLSLILVCLVLLVIRAYQGPVPAQDTLVSSATIEPMPPADETYLKPAPRPAAKSVIPVRPAPAAIPAPSRPVAAQPRLAEPEPESTTEQVAAVIGQPVVVRVPAPGITNSGDASEGTAPISGIVTLLGTPKPEIVIPMTATCGRLQSGPVTTRHYVMGPEGRLANVFVYISEGVQKKYSPPADEPLLDQVNCMYEPYVMGVMAGQTFQIRNSDQELHNVHATPKVNREFNFGQPLRGQTTRRSFPLPEVLVRLKCDVHPWMFAYVGVVGHPFHAVTGSNGTFHLPASLPDGDYSVNAYHLKAGEIIRRATIKDGQPLRLDFQFPSPLADPNNRVVRAN